MTIVANNREHVFPRSFTGQRGVTKKMKLLSRYPEVTDLATLQTVEKSEKVKNTARNKTM